MATTPSFEFDQKHDITEQLQQMNVFVLSSQAEGIPISVLEAQATGLAIIATKVGGLPELISSESQGLLVESENVQQLATAMSRLLASPEEIIRQGATNREFIKRSFFQRPGIVCALSYSMAHSIMTD